MRTELSNDFIRIRRYRSEDVELLFEAASESTSEISEWMPWCHPNYSIEDSETFISSRKELWEQKAEFDFAVFEKQTNLFLGGVGLNQFNQNNNFANLGYWVRSSQTGRAVATSATILMAELGFADLGLSRIEIVTAVGNDASARVAEKAGAKREGVLRNRIVLHERSYDAVMYSLIAN